MSDYKFVTEEELSETEDLGKFEILLKHLLSERNAYRQVAIANATHTQGHFEKIHQMPFFIGDLGKDIDAEAEHLLSFGSPIPTSLDKKFCKQMVPCECGNIYVVTIRVRDGKVVEQDLIRKKPSPERGII